MDLIERNDVGGVTRLVLNAPTKLNALSDAMIAALHGTLDDIAASDTRVVVIAGAGRAFCAGHDLREMQALRQAEDGGAAGFADLFARCAEMMQRIRTLPQPVIAEVHGIATAAGCQLVASCDLAIADHDARFGVNGVNIGLFCSTPMVALTRNLSRKRAFEVLTTGAFLSAHEALEAGLINRVAGPGSLETEATAFAEQIASKLPEAVRIGKRLFYDQLETSLEDAYRMTGAAMVDNMLEQNTDEGINAFLEKRPPNWPTH